MALATPRTPSEPRAGWSAATIISRPSAPSSGRRRRSAARAAISSGRLARSSRSASKSGSRSVASGGDDPPEPPRSGILGPQEILDLFGGRHRGRALQPGGDDGPGGVGEADDPLQRPAGQQPVAQRAAEPVAGADPVDHLDLDRRDLHLLVLGPRVDARRALL